MTSVAPMSQCYIIKQMVHTIAYTIELWNALGRFSKHLQCKKLESHSAINSACYGIYNELRSFRPKSVSPQVVSPQLEVVSPQLEVVSPQLKDVSPRLKVSSPEVFSYDFESNKWLT